MHVLAVALSALVLPGFHAAAQEPSGGMVLSGTFPGTVRAGDVYLPPGFDSSRRYPVVYLLHGLPGDPSEYIDGTRLGEFADNAISKGTVRPFIAIVPAAGATAHYDGEWAGPWETALVGRIVPWVDKHLPTIAEPSGRIIAGLSAGGYGAVDIAFRHPGLFGTVESWSGYFRPLNDPPFVHADKATLNANNPMKLARSEAAVLRGSKMRFFLSTGPVHSHLFTPQETIDFAEELEGLRLPVRLRVFSSMRDGWRSQLDAGLTWALS
jgi:enterochelin esterase-like enzyme